MTYDTQIVSNYIPPRHIQQKSEEGKKLMTIKNIIKLSILTYRSYISYSSVHGVNGVNGVKRVNSTRLITYSKTHTHTHTHTPTHTHTHTPTHTHSQCGCSLRSFQWPSCTWDTVCVCVGGVCVWEGYEWVCTCEGYEWACVTHILSVSEDVIGCF